MNRLKQYLEDKAPQTPEGDYWVIETRSEDWVVSADTARTAACGHAATGATR